MVSKTFTTVETTLNAKTLRAWLRDGLGEQDVSNHLAAVSTAIDKTVEFGNFHADLPTLAAAHAGPVRRVGDAVGDLPAFVETYIGALVERYTHIRDEYHHRQQAFDTLFRNQPLDAAGSFVYRWEQVLHRLDATTPQQIETALRVSVENACPC